MGLCGIRRGVGAVVNVLGGGGRGKGEIGWIACLLLCLVGGTCALYSGSAQ